MADTPAPFWKRLGWMALIWAVSVTALGLVAMVIHTWLRP